MILWVPARARLFAVAVTPGNGSAAPFCRHYGLFNGRITRLFRFKDGYLWIRMFRLYLLCLPFRLLHVSQIQTSAVAPAPFRRAPGCAEAVMLNFVQPSQTGRRSFIR
jgi:hypothetical protein